MQDSPLKNRLVIPCEGSELVLTQDGIICPLILLEKRQQASLQAEGLTQIFIGWDKIRYWTAAYYPYPSDMMIRRSAGLQPEWYNISLKVQSEDLNDDTLRISRKMLAGYEKAIIEFAQPHVDFKFDPMRVTWRNSWLYILIATGAILALALAMSRCNLLDSECMKKPWHF
jgi:hypothetical protein